MGNRWHGLSWPTALGWCERCCAPAFHCPASSPKTWLLIPTRPLTCSLTWDKSCYGNLCSAITCKVMWVLSKVLVPPGAKRLLFKSLIHILVPSLPGHCLFSQSHASTWVMSRDTHQSEQESPSENRHPISEICSFKNILIHDLLSSLVGYLSVKVSSRTHHQPLFWCHPLASLQRLRCPILSNPWGKDTGLHLTH